MVFLEKRHYQNKKKQVLDGERFMKKIYGDDFLIKCLVLFGMISLMCINLTACGNSTNKKEESEGAVSTDEPVDDAEMEPENDSISTSTEAEGDNNKDADFGSWEARFGDSMDEISFSEDYSEVTVCFTLTNLDDYEKHPEDYFILEAIQDDQELELLDGDLKEILTGLEKKEYYMTYALVSDNPILLRMKDVNGAIWSEGTVPVEGEY